ncbi:exonuclease domain-containing protein [Nocardioides sp.]|uniref:3'-5' exonuclease n=1 Tax=Nocardioides sp. TaxID=35761 RepID=UPI00273660C8|nr:exonuclease domain-containing protein [Nocardioides sp.]MDP3892495.1 exonuclease domain-containing protein [Nocardioides sp.]
MNGVAPVAVALLGLMAAAGLVAGVLLLLRRRRDVLTRLAEDVDVIVGANPAHRLTSAPSGPLTAVTAAVNRLASEREESLHAAEASAADLRREVESERNRLADLMARLGVAVVVCNADGRILLYNDSARSLVADPALLGLGRTVFGLVDRGLIAHARLRLEAGGATYTATTLHRGRMLRVLVAPVQESTDLSVSGMVLVLEDLTREAGAADERQRALRRLTEEIRGSLGSIRAAAETLLEFPDLADADRRRFLEVVGEESDRLTHSLDGATGDVRPSDERGLDHISGADLAAVIGDRLGRSAIVCRDVVASSTGQVWLRADAHALAAVLAFVAERLGGADLGGVDLELSVIPDHVRLDLRWTGSPPYPGVLTGWLDEPLGQEGATTGRQVVERHAAEVWAGQDAPGRAQLSVLLPHTGEHPGDARGPGTATARPAPTPEHDDSPAPHGSRPEFYDFDLFTSTDPEERSSRLLADLTFTVLDTETTGLDPAGGDRIVSLGAVRVVNGRVLRQETFEQLVNPGRRVPAASTAIHGLTDAMLADAPRIEDVLPELTRFAEDTVLVGHDLGFDLRFLAPAARSAGLELTQPVLDTLLLDVALFPGQRDHTLETIAGRLGVSVVGRHTALGDALVTADVLIGLLGPLREAGVQTLDEALTASRRAFRSRARDRSPGG